MAAKLIATARWRALDRDGEDTCRLSQTEKGWMLVGHAQFHDALGRAALNYIVRCDAHWTTQSVDLAGRHGESDVRARIYRVGKSWRFSNRDQPAVNGAQDIDLSFTPATNLMPIRRMGGGMSVTAAWFQYPCAKLVPLHQTYAAADTRDTVHYHAEQTSFTTDLRVDRSGFITHYPGFWEGDVTHAT